MRMVWIPLLLLCSVAAFAGEAAAPKLDAWVVQAKEEVWKSVGPIEEKQFERLGDPVAGDWLASFNEPPQTFERYTFNAKVRPTDARRTIVLQPLGAFTPEQSAMLETLRAYTETFFQLPTRIAEPMALPEEPAYIRQVPMGHRRPDYDHQYNADLLISGVLIPHLPRDAAVILGITYEDLWSERMNFVFGLGAMQDRAGVYSLRRFDASFWGAEKTPETDARALWRAYKVLNHETGHMFGLGHCIFYKCSMNGSNTLREMDAAPAHFCPVCHKKLAWALGLDPAKRFKELETFYRKTGFPEEADWTRERARTYAVIQDKRDE